jgi:tetratricopeptide (TPR) repeat protein
LVSRSRRAAGSLALIALLALGICASSVRAEPEGSDARLDQAAALLGSPERYPDAVELYRAVLADHPEQRAARLQLARVLAWSQRYDESLSEFAELIRAYPEDPSLVVERSEVLSWSGQLDAARAGFEAVLAADPHNARAARGLARCYSWGGKRGRADRAYARALELEDDREARAEWEQLRAPLRPRTELQASYFTDSADVDREELGLEYSGFQSVETRISARLATIRVGHSQKNVTPRARSRHDRDRAYELGFGIDRGLDNGTRVSAEAGGRDWTYAGDSLFARGHLEHSFEGIGSLGLHLVHEDFADASNSYEAVSNDVHHTAVAASFYRQLSARAGAFARADLGRISDSNTRRSAYASVSYLPTGVADLDLSLGASYVSYSDRSDFYYDPKRDVGLEASLEHRVPLTPALRFEYQAALGFQSTKEDGSSESGTLWAARAGLRYEQGPWGAFARYGTSYSQRSSRYHYQTAELRIERKF